MNLHIFETHEYNVVETLTAKIMFAHASSLNGEKYDESDEKKQQNDEQNQQKYQPNKGALVI